MLSKTLNKLYRLTWLQGFFIILIISSPIFLKLFQIEGRYFFATTIATYGVIYFLLAFSLYLFLLCIRKIRRSNIQKRLVKFTRLYIRFHIGFAVLGILFIMLHIGIMAVSVPLVNSQSLSGIASGLTLICVLISGYMRKQKSSGKRRRYHRYFSFLFLLSVIIHLVI